MAPAKKGPKKARKPRVVSPQLIKARQRIRGLLNEKDELIDELRNLESELDETKNELERNRKTNRESAKIIADQARQLHVTRTEHAELTGVLMELNTELGEGDKDKLFLIRQLRFVAEKE